MQRLLKILQWTQDGDLQHKLEKSSSSKFSLFCSRVDSSLNVAWKMECIPKMIFFNFKWSSGLETLLTSHVAPGLTVISRRLFCHCSGLKICGNGGISGKGNLISHLIPLQCKRFQFKRAELHLRGLNWFLSPTRLFVCTAACASNAADSFLCTTMIRH